MSIGFILLAHEDPILLKPLILSLIRSGSNVYIHYDLNSNHDLKQACREWDINSLGEGKVFFARKIKVQWGEWSIVQATLNALNEVRKADFLDDFYILLSGSCMPIKPLSIIEDKLLSINKDHIEITDAETTSWVVDGIQSSRWTKFHFFNWRSQPLLFSLSLKIQDKLHIRRSLPLKHHAYMGSQWWCLRQSTIVLILTFLDKHSKLMKFYHRTWVPDELFFQTIVGNLIPHDEIVSSPITFYKFNSWGIPRVFYNDGFNELVNNSSLLARKIAPDAYILKNKLENLFLMKIDDFHKLQSKSKLPSEKSKSNMLSPLFLPDNPYDIIKYINNKIYIVCTDNVKLKKYVIKSLSSSREFQCFGYLLNKDRIDFGEGNKELAGYRNDQPNIAHHKWYYFFYDVVRTVKGKNILFFVNTDSLNFLEYFKYRSNATIILLDSKNNECDEDFFTYLTSPSIGENQAFNKKVSSILSDADCVVKTLTVDMSYILKEEYYDTDSCTHT